MGDEPSETSLWTVEHFVDEVEHVRQALGLNKENFYLLDHSWGALLALEYAFAYRDNLKGLIISNMMNSSSGYAKYVEDVLAKGLDYQVWKEIREIEANNDLDNLLFKCNSVDAKMKFDQKKRQCGKLSV